MSTVDHIITEMVWTIISIYQCIDIPPVCLCIHRAYVCAYWLQACTSRWCSVSECLRFSMSLLKWLHILVHNDNPCIHVGIVVYFMLWLVLCCWNLWFVCVWNIDMTTSAPVGFSLVMKCLSFLCNKMLFIHSCLRSTCPFLSCWYLVKP